MESSATDASLSWWEFVSLFLRPLLAVVFVLSILSLGWCLAWKLVLVHVPLVQEIFGLRKKEKKQKPPTHRRFSQIYNSVDARNRASQCWEGKLCLVSICRSFCGFLPSRFLHISTFIQRTIFPSGPAKLLGVQLIILLLEFWKNMMEINSDNDEIYEFISDGMKVTVTCDSDEPTDDYLETSSISSSEASEASCSLDNELDSDMWSPPEPQDFEDDISSVTKFEEEDDGFGEAMILDDECDVSKFGEEGSVGCRFKKEKRKVLEKMLNEEFKAHVAHLLKFVDICKLEPDGESWVDIVASLAWKAAAFVKPDALKEKARNLNHFVKIMCVACGSHSQSQLVNGLVFSKNAVHKHMPTELKNPRLLIVRGFLGQSSNGFISFDTTLLHAGKNQLITLAQCLETSGANVILVEKAVCRDLVEFILHRGLHMTIVSNMKLNRLERVARCTGSPILPVDTTILSQDLRQCNRIVFQKNLEEHAHVKEGRRGPYKTLMFIEGCPTRLGCTILLKGSHIEELKKIKRVVRAAVFKAYHLIREISFCMDLNAVFSTYAPLTSPTADQSISNDINLGRRGSCSEPVLGSLSSSNEKLVSNEQSQPLDAYSTVATSSRDVTYGCEDGTERADPTLRPSGLSRKVVMMTILNFSRGIVCDHGRCSHTNFTLGKYIRDYLLNQNLKCKTCREHAEAHIYYYARNNQQLAVRVQRLPDGKYLAGAEEERVWFWSRCAKCKLDNEDLNYAKRVSISNEALVLPFGSFLELHFSEPSPFNFSSICGHSPHKDFLLFIGSGSMVAVFKYSPMVTSEMWEANGTGIGEFAKIEVLPLLGMLMSCCESKHLHS